MFFASCSGESDAPRYAEMQDYYTESIRLPQVTIDSVTLFSRKVDTFVGLHPDATDDPLYPQIRNNIRQASLRFTIEVDTAWNGEIHIVY